MDSLKEALRQLWAGPCSCTRCRRPLSPPVFSCSSSHLFCVVCSRNKPLCVVCNAPLSQFTWSTFQQVLQLLPKVCMFTGCPEVFADKQLLQEHEVWCGRRPSPCRVCVWTGPANSLYSHCLKDHLVLHRSAGRTLDVSVDPRQKDPSLCVLCTLGQVFWVKCCAQRTGVTLQVLWEPDGAVRGQVFEARVDFKVGEDTRSITKTILHQSKESQETTFKMHTNNNNKKSPVTISLLFVNKLSSSKIS